MLNQFFKMNVVAIHLTSVVLQKGVLRSGKAKKKILYFSTIIALDYFKMSLVAREFFSVD